MCNNKIYRNLYLICFVLTFAISIFISFPYINQFVLAILNLILFIISYVLLCKNKLKNINIWFPIIYIVFIILVGIIAFLFNYKVFIAFVHYDYYISFVLFNYLLLNLYSILSFSKTEKKN